MMMTMMMLAMHPINGHPDASIYLCEQRLGLKSIRTWAFNTGELAIRWMF
jgi:hypothetical protein